MTASRAILWSSLVVGVLDATDGVIAYGLRGFNPIQVLQYIASGLLGPTSYKGGMATAGLGTLLHFFIAFVVAAIYILASRAVPVLKSQAAVFGLIYGAAVYLFMTYLVLPRSAIGPTPFDLGLFLNGVIGHALFVGLPTALFSRRAE
jgi:uncharacterized membrane protein YagU involved in acid resistance